MSSVTLYLIPVIAKRTPQKRERFLTRPYIYRCNGLGCDITKTRILHFPRALVRMSYRHYRAVPSVMSSSFHVTVTVPFPSEGSGSGVREGGAVAMR